MLNFFDAIPAFSSTLENMNALRILEADLALMTYTHGCSDAQNKVAVITGATGGIGSTFAKTLSGTRGNSLRHLFRAPGDHKQGRLCGGHSSGLSAPRWTGILTSGSRTRYAEPVRLAACDVSVVLASRQVAARGKGRGRNSSTILT